MSSTCETFCFITIPISEANTDVDLRIADRPRVNVGITLEEDVRKIWEKSKDKYYEAADVVYQTDRKTIEEEIEELKRIISDRTE